MGGNSLRTVGTVALASDSLIRPESDYQGQFRLYRNVGAEQLRI